MIIVNCDEFDGDFTIGMIVSTFAAVHNAYIEQLDSSVYKIELYIILSYIL